MEGLSAQAIVPMQNRDRSAALKGVECAAQGGGTPRGGSWACCVANSGTWAFLMSVGRIGTRSALACVAVLALLGLMTVSASAETISFRTQGCKVWTAPSNVEVLVQAVGAAGEGQLQPGGRGDGVSALIPARSGEQFDVCVDQGGGEKDFQGGGWSGVLRGTELVQANAQVVAAGGGGAQRTAGGDAGHPGQGPHGGGAGTLEAGGAPGGENAEAGSSFKGGNAGGPSGIFAFAGAGGGGYYGGGGGSWQNQSEGEGGGGGSDFCGNGVIECATQAAVGTVHGADAGSNEAHVTLTTSPLAAPTVTKVTPTSGPANGDKVITITITGTGFRFMRAVKFGSVVASKYFVNKAETEIGVDSPAQEVAGTVDVTVTTAVGTSKITTKDHYKYLPVITSIKPNSGPAGVEQQVEIFGAGFKPGASEIFFGTTLVGNANCFTPTFCAAVSPALPKGKVEVKVKVNGLTSIKTTAALYTYF
jgi:IPT/TIG domain-containing protein